MLTIRNSKTRYYADYGWLQTFRSFSFDNHHDPLRMGWTNLRAFNEDRVMPGTGFGTHSHRDMEIVSYVVSGNLAHKDSMGNIKGIPAGDVQRMSAGTGVQHSEFNHAPDQPTHFFQIWFIPDALGIPPSYEQKQVSPESKRGALSCIAAPVGGLVKIHADAALYAGLFDGDESALLPLAPRRKGYVHVSRGSIQVNGVALTAGDAVLLDNEPAIHLTHGEDADVFVFDLAP